MAVQASTLPANLPPRSHLHLANFVVPDTSIIDGAGVHKLLREITGDPNPHVKKEFGRKYQYNEYYTLRNTENSVLLTAYIGGSGKFKNTVAVSINGLCFETWSALNPVTIDPVELIRFVFSRGGWFSRLDVARNDYRRVIDWPELIDCSHKRNFRDRIVTRLCKTNPPYYCRQDAEGIYFGSDKSRTQVYAYFKQDQVQSKFPWIRIETKVRGKQQCNHIASLLLEGMDIDRLSGGLLAYLLDFKESVNGDGTETIYDKRNRLSLDWWVKFVGPEKIRLLPPKVKEEIGDELSDIEF